MSTQERIIMRAVWSIGVISICAAFLLAGCSATHFAKPDDPQYAPVMPDYNVPSQPVNGAIYQPYQRISYFVDRKARHVGDILTINLVERTTASKKAETEIDKSSSHNLSAPTLPFTSITDKLNDQGLATSIDGSNSFTGEAESDQSNSLSGNITVTVTDVLPNGVLRVRGEKWMTLNTGNEYIRITGMVRYEDISPENEVPSTRLADARITYSGTGSFANSNEMGWFSKFFVGPLWPF